MPQYCSARFLLATIYNKGARSRPAPPRWPVSSLESAMSRQPTPPVAAKDLQGFKYFALITPLLARLHDDGTACDKAGNRRLFFDQYAALLLLYFFNPILTSFNGLQQASALDKVKKITGGPRVSKGSLSEAQGIFHASLLQGIIAEL